MRSLLVGLVLVASCGGGDPMPDARNGFVDGAVVDVASATPDAVPEPPDAGPDAQVGPCDGPEDCGGNPCCLTGADPPMCTPTGATCVGLELCHMGSDCATDVCCPQGFCGPGCD
jgi:hypothetical protein